MNVKMAGVNYQGGTVAQREAFAFTKAQAKKAMVKLRAEENVSSVILSTCNRTELWISGELEGKDPKKLLKKLKPRGKETILVGREGDYAVNYLFHLACGLESQLLGEDQILTQIKEALTLSRECQCDNTMLEKVFQGAIKGAKRVKTSVSITRDHPSLAKRCAEVLVQEKGSLKDIKCLVIGNGNMGKLMVSALQEEHAKVTMTLRKKMHKKEEKHSIVPSHCQMIDYEKRLENIEDYHVVISATLSPHMTIFKKEIEEKKFQNQIFIDMAMPRDIEETVGSIEGIRLFNIDDLGSYLSRGKPSHMKEAQKIIEEEMESIKNWFTFREYIPQIERIVSLVKTDTLTRLEHQEIGISVEKSLGKILYGLREQLPENYMKECFAALEKVAESNTVKTGEKNR